jgi:hypothetical protein
LEEVKIIPVGWFCERCMKQMKIKDRDTHIKRFHPDLIEQDGGER